MTYNSKYHGDDLAAVVWLTDSAAKARAGELTWAQAARAAWAIEAAKADRVVILVAVDENDDIVHAWRVVGVGNETAVPSGKSRKINRCRFEIEDDPALDYLVGPSPWKRRRNPQTTLELRDLPGFDALLSDNRPPAHGLVRLGDYTLFVREDGSAELHIPHGQVVTIRTAS